MDKGLHVATCATRSAGLALFTTTLLTAALLWSRQGGATWWQHLEGFASLGSGPPVPKMPWATLLTPEEQSRGVTSYGGGSRLRHVASKLLAGRPVKAFTLGGSVTYGHGVEDLRQAYPSLLFRYINTTFPHRQHRLVNRGLPGATSQVTAPCVFSMVDQDADLVILEFSTNDSPGPWNSQGRAAFEGLLRSLLALPGAPAVVVLHQYAWWKAAGDGRSSGLFYREPEGQLTTLSQYYDVPSVSLRAATWRLMHAGIEGFKVDRTILEGKRDATTGAPIPVADASKSGDYAYLDTIHPGPSGHQALAELLAGLLGRAVAEVAAGVAPAGRRDPRLQGLPPPMIPTFQDSTPSFCAQLEAFKPMVVRQRGFQYRPEKPHLPRFEEQKWGWGADEPGAWAEIEVNTLQPPPCTNASTTGGSNNNSASSRGNGAACIGSAGSGGQQSQAWVVLSHLKSYSGMGTALVECRSGCSCQPTVLDGTTASRVSVFKTHSFKVSQHKRCLVRATVRRDPGETAQEGHKVLLAAVMVTHSRGQRAKDG